MRPIVFGSSIANRSWVRPNSARLAAGKESSFRSVQVSAGGLSLAGDLTIPTGATGLVLFAHGSGSSRHSQRNRFVARLIQASGLATFLFDLLTSEEEQEDAIDAHLRFDIGLLARRLIGATLWIKKEPETRHLGLAYFGASTGGAAALVAAAELGSVIRAIVSRGGRPDLAGEALSQVVSPTLLIVGERDEFVLPLNRRAYLQLRCQKQLALVTGSTHLFEEAGALEAVASLATKWFQKYFSARENSL